MNNTKGIILAGGMATRLFPITKTITKQLLPIYDKPMIYYPLTLLMLAKIRDIAIIVSPEQKKNFSSVLKDGSQWGIKLTYLVQNKPDGIGQAYIIAEKFLNNDNSLMILGDNLFYGNKIQLILKNILEKKIPSIFGYQVSDPERYGVISFNGNKVSKIIEKPKKPASNFVVTGLYYLDKNASKYAKKIKKSKRGELEISDILNIYLKNKNLHTELFGRGFAWLDTGTADSLLDASNFVKTIQARQGSIVGSPEEISLLNKWISKNKINNMIKTNNKSEYFNYLNRLID